MRIRLTWYLRYQDFQKKKKGKPIDSVGVASGKLGRCCDLLRHEGLVLGQEVGKGAGWLVAKEVRVEGVLLDLCGSGVTLIETSSLV